MRIIAHVSSSFAISLAGQTLDLKFGQLPSDFLFEEYRLRLVNSRRDLIRESEVAASFSSKASSSEVHQSVPTDLLANAKNLNAAVLVLESITRTI